MQSADKNNPVWKNVVLSAYSYIIFMLMVYALFVGFRMSDMLSSNDEIGSFLKSAHFHVLTDSFLMLLLIYDLKLKRLEGVDVPRAVPILGLGVLGVILVAAGFSIAAFFPQMIARASMCFILAIRHFFSRFSLMS